MPTLSIIIPTFNGEKYLAQLIGTLQKQSVSPAQILVVDSSSKDNTLKICRDFGVDFFQIETKTFDHGGSRNLAASRATGDILVFLTQDALLVDENCLKYLIEPLDNPSIAASYGRQIPREDANPVERFLRLYNYPSTGRIKGIGDLPRLGVKTFFFSNVCSAIKKSAFEEVGGFPQKTIRNEDMALAAKLIMKGYRIAYQANALVYHSHYYSIATQFKRYFDIGVFFRRNLWVRELADSEREGIKYVKEIFKFLADNQQWNWIPYALVDTSVRFLGYKIGMMEEFLPLWFKKKVSYHKYFWVS